MARMVRLDGLSAVQLVDCITMDPTGERSTYLGLLLVSACFVLLLLGFWEWYGCIIYVIDFVCYAMWDLPEQAVHCYWDYTAIRLYGLQVVPA